MESIIGEIDVTCNEATKPSLSVVSPITSVSTFQNSNLHTSSCPTTENNIPVSSRQMILDRYFESTFLKSENQNVRYDEEDNLD